MSAFVCEPLKDGILLEERIRTLKPRRVLLIFWHGVGDLVMFLPVLGRIRGHYMDWVSMGANVRGVDLKPLVEFDLGVPKGLTYKHLVPDAVELTGEEVNDTPQNLPYDLVVKITFPMNEGQTVLTKGEWCCKHEIGLPETWGHGALPKHRTPLVAVHFNITCLPDSCNPDRDTAERIWNDILEVGLVPMECHFQHIFHNPVNAKFDFIDASVRRCRPELSSLLGLISHARAFVGVVSGPFHVALSMLGHEKVMLLEKDFKKECFTKLPVKTANLRDYKGEVKEFLKAV